MFAGHDVSCPYKCEERAGRMPALQERRVASEIEERSFDCVSRARKPRERQNARNFAPFLRQGRQDDGARQRQK